MKKVLAGILVATTVLGLVGCGNSGTKGFLQRQCRQKKRLFMENPRDHIQSFFEDAIVPILEEKGYTVKGVDLSDLQTADIALNDGEVDVNVEQHTAYMENFNKSYNGDLVAISPIPTVPAGVYSDKYDSPG